MRIQSSNKRRTREKGERAPLKKTLKLKKRVSFCEYSARRGCCVVRVLVRIVRELQYIPAVMARVYQDRGERREHGHGHGAALKMALNGDTSCTQARPSAIRRTCPS
eukprot:scaffold29946_cov118-Isochrysis_galbana.AAC.2